jgi:glycosyltransferase involved in cell wall biosynthesis
MAVDTEPELSIGWLWRARRNVRVLHFQWRADRYYAWQRQKPDVPDRPAPRSQGLRSWIRLVAFAARLGAARLLGYRLVWTIHDIYPAETLTRPRGSVSRRIDQLGSRLLARSSHLLLAHADAVAEHARARLGRAAERIQLVPHGSYLGVYAPGLPRAAIRRELGLAPGAFTFLCFGALRADKGIELLLEAFCSIDDPNLALVVAGAVEDAPSWRSVLAAAESDPRIRPLLEYIPDERVRELFDAADAFVLARSEIRTPASLILALSLGVPIVAAELPPHPELLGDGEAGWLYRPGDAESLRAGLREAARDRTLARAKGASAIKQAERLPSWSHIAERTAALIMQCFD